MTSTAVATTNGKGVTALIQASSARLTPLLPDGLTLEKLAQIAYFETIKNPEILKCTPDSIVSAVERVLRSGLELGETSYLVPLGNTCSFVAGYTGLAQRGFASRV